VNMRMQQDNNAGDRSISRRGRKKKGVIETLSCLRNDRSKLTKICQESSVDANNYTPSVIEDEWNASDFSVYDPSNDDGNDKEEERDNPSVTTATVRGMDGTGVSNGSPNTASIAGHTMAVLEDEITMHTATFMTNEEEMKERRLSKKVHNNKKQRQRGGNGDGDRNSAAAGGGGEVRDEFGRRLTTTTTHCKNTESASSSSRRYDCTMIKPRAVLLRRTNVSNHSPSWAPPDEARTGCGGTVSDFSVYDPLNKDVDENDQSPNDNNNNIGDGVEVTNPTNDTDKDNSTEASKCKFLFWCLCVVLYDACSFLSHSLTPSMQAMTQ
jgi:hypothetical protein